MPTQADMTGVHRPFFNEDDQDWMENQLYSRRHEGLYESRLERMQREWQEENAD